MVLMMYTGVRKRMNHQAAAGKNGRKSNINAATSGQHHHHHHHQRSSSSTGLSGSGKSAFKPPRGGRVYNINSGSSSRNNSIRNSDTTTQQSTTSSLSSWSKREDEDGNHVPGTNVVRIMRTVLPAHAKVSDGAKESIQECVTEYISLITSEANERCMREHRKTLTPEDLLYAMAKLGFDDYIQPLTLYLNRYRASESQRTTINGEPSVYRAVNYSQPPQHSRFPPPPATYFNPAGAAHHSHQIGPTTTLTSTTPEPPSPVMYLVNAVDAMRGFQGFRLAHPISQSTMSTPVGNFAPAIPTGRTTISSVYPYNTGYINPLPQPTPPTRDNSNNDNDNNNPDREFFK